MPNPQRRTRSRPISFEERMPVVFLHDKQYPGTESLDHELAEYLETQEAEQEDACDTTHQTALKQVSCGCTPSHPGTSTGAKSRV